ncbi:hypothetical protein ACSQ67_000319 [Phaseolus vulgaris]
MNTRWYSLIVIIQNLFRTSISKNLRELNFTPSLAVGQRFNLGRDDLNVLTQTSFRVLQVSQRPKRNDIRRRAMVTYGMRYSVGLWLFNVSSSSSEYSSLLSE